jgi:geranylgeranyl pyrophosphate synthase
MSEWSAQDFQDWASRRQQRIERVLAETLARPGVPARLQEALQYSVLGGGKRLRPLLVYAGAEVFGASIEAVDAAAAAVECMHAYSLIHDDLPAMDDDVLRRGRPTCHVRFDESTAILAGDALQALAFELLAVPQQPPCSPSLQLQMIAELARASGWQGMVAGQALDIAATGSVRSEQELVDMHGLKTGALITASVLLGALGSGQASQASLTALRQYAQWLGLAFQIKDDILDVEASTAVSGKQQGKDAKQGKATYTSLLGVEAARQRLAAAAAAASAALGAVSTNVEVLRCLVRFVVERES